MTARESLDKLLASKPGVDIDIVDGQIGKPDVEDEMIVILGREPGPWVCVDFVDGEKFAIWKTTGAIYRVDENGAVEDDPIKIL